ncbi:MAG TPA: DUF433 domain-containing protein [Planctomycetota bacterium]|nr:DUF433 domain-containing protein [Planctomycetota bacterium]
MELEDALESNPAIHNGFPIFKGTTVPIDTLFEAIESGSNIDEYMKLHPGISKEQIEVVMAAGRVWQSGLGMGYPWNR